MADSEGPYELREIEIEDVHFGSQKHWSLYHDGRQIAIFFNGKPFDLEEWEELVHWMNEMASPQASIEDMRGDVPKSGRHALITGIVLGSLEKAIADAGDFIGAEVELIDDQDGNHLDAFRLRKGEESYLIRVIPEHLMP